MSGERPKPKSEARIRILYDLSIALQNLHFSWGDGYRRERRKFEEDREKDQDIFEKMVADGPLDLS